MDTVKDIRWRMIEGGGRTTQTFGLSKLLGQIYMLLYMHAEARSLDDIAAELEISKASVSIACRQLDALGALRRVWRKGDRKDYYEPVTDLRRILTGNLLDAANRSLASARQQIGDCLMDLDGRPADSGEAAFVEKRLREAENQCKRIQGLLDNPLVRKLV